MNEMIETEDCGVDTPMIYEIKLSEEEVSKHKNKQDFIKNVCKKRRWLCDNREDDKMLDVLNQLPEKKIRKKVLT